MKGRNPTKADMSITFMNNSSQPLQLHDHSSEAALNAVILESPPKTLNANADPAVLAWVRTGVGLAKAGRSGTLRWVTPDGVAFGIRITAPKQVLGAGSAPYYSVYLDKGDWIDIRTNDAYFFDDDRLGFTATVEAVGGRHSLHVTVTITDAS